MCVCVCVQLNRTVRVELLSERHNAGTMPYREAHSHTDAHQKTTEAKCR